MVLYKSLYHMNYYIIIEVKKSPEREIPHSLGWKDVSLSYRSL